MKAKDVGRTYSIRVICLPSHSGLVLRFSVKRTELSASKVDKGKINPLFPLGFPFTPIEGVLQMFIAF
jgi:hypothetical protein